MIPRVVWPFHILQRSTEVEGFQTFFHIDLCPTQTEKFGFEVDLTSLNDSFTLQLQTENSGLIARIVKKNSG